MTATAKLHPNTTQVPNIILDEWMSELTPAEFKVIMLIARQTYGWHKEEDRISYSQLITRTGYGADTIVVAVKSLRASGRIIVTDSGGNQLHTVEECRGKSLYYKLNLETTRKSREVENNYSENPSWKSRDTKETNTKDKTLLLRNNERAHGIKRIGDLVKDRIPIRSLSKDNHITQGFQFYAYQAADIAGLKNGGRSRLFQVFKANNYGEFQVKKTAEVIKHPTFLKLPNEQAKVAYLAGAFRRSL